MSWTDDTLLGLFDDLQAVFSLEPIGPQHRETLRGVYASALTSAMYLNDVDGEVDVLHLAGCLMFHVAKVLHGITDGNKRLAWLAVTNYLHSTAGLSLDVSEEEAHDYVLSLADESDRPTRNDVITWLSERIVSADAVRPPTPSDLFRRDPAEASSPASPTALDVPGSASEPVSMAG